MQTRLYAITPTGFFTRRNWGVHFPTVLVVHWLHDYKRVQCSLFGFGLVVERLPGNTRGPF